MPARRRSPQPSPSLVATGDREAIISQDRAAIFSLRNDTRYISKPGIFSLVVKCHLLSPPGSLLPQPSRTESMDTQPPPIELLDTQGIENDPVAAATFAFDGVHTRTVDLQDPARVYGVPITSTFEVLARETIEILDRPRDTLAVRESNTAGTIRWSFENRYWFDFESGFLWKSVQHFARNVAPLEMEILKPAR